MNILTVTHPQALDIALLLIRVVFGLCFVTHGLGKLGIVGPGTMAGFESWLKSLSVPMPALNARLAMLSELVGGLLVSLGFLMRPAACLILLTMIVAGLIGHKGGGYLITNNPPGNEYTVNLAVVMIVLILLGPGAYSLDAWLLN